VCRQVSRSGSRQQDSSADPRDAILILLVNPEVIKNNEQSAYQVLSHPELAGHVASTGPRVKFDNLRVPAKNLLAAPGKGAILVEQAFTFTAVLVGAMSVSIMRAAYEAALKFSKQDTRGGAEPIIGRQSVSNLLMNVKMNCDASRALTLAAAHAVETGRGAEMALEAKIFCSDIATKSVVDAMSAVGV
jgi:alkylation response protein AidB-like acyl-CoA dehydrogenase